MVKSRSTTRAAEQVQQRPRAGSLFVVVIVLAVGQMMAAGPQAAAAADDPGPAKVVVSLTWDDGRASQTGSLAIQAKYGYPATYYINSAEIGAGPGKLTKGQLDVIAASGGNEIGGHTDHHVDLTSLPPAQVTSEICNDRSRLVGWYGAAAGRSFAYPFGAVNSTAKAAVQGCGYQSARGVGRPRQHRA